MQSFFTFDVSAIPDSATIQEARLYYFTSSEWNLGAPFDDLGSLRVYHHNYGDLSADDYTIIPTFAEDTSILTIHSKAAWLDQPKSLNSRGVAALQDSLASDLFGIRIQFSEETDGDGEADHIVTTVELGVTYRL